MSAGSDTGSIVLPRIEELAPWEDGAGIAARLDAAHDELTPQELRVAEFLRLHLDDLALFSATEVAERSGVSKATVSRLLRRLGYRDSQEFRDEARSLRARGVPVRSASVAGAGADGEEDDRAALLGHLASEHLMLDRLAETLDPALLRRAADALCVAHNVVVLGMRNSQSVALHLREQLLQARPDVHLAPIAGQTLAEELADLGPLDAVILVAVRRRVAGLREVIDAITARRIPLILIGDPSVRHLTRGVPLFFEVPIGSAGAFDSYVGVMSLSAMLADAVLDARGSAGEERVERILALHDELSELERR